MPADDRLILLLRSLQTHSDQQDTPRLLSTASYVLATLSNPLNLTVVTAQLLFAPAVWTRPDGLRSCMRFMGVFQSAALTILRREDEESDGSRASRDPTAFAQPVIGGNMTRDVWVRSVLQGADERSLRWRHLLVIAGLLLGFEGQDKRGLSRSLQSTLNTAFVKALNLSLADVRNGDELGASCVALALNYAFPILSDVERSSIDYYSLLPILIGSAFFSQEGYRSGYFLANVDRDVIQISKERFSWSDRSRSYAQLARMSSQPLITGMGPLSRLIAHTVENCKDPLLVQAVMDDLSGFAQTLMTQWRQTKLSEVDASEEKIFFDRNALSTTLPVLWKLLRSSLFAIVIILRGCMTRVVNDGGLAGDEVAPVLATQTLLTLRHLYFIASRSGSSSFSQYTFVYLAALDILSAYPAHSEAFLRAIGPKSLGLIPSRPLDRTLDLYFLNASEHFTLALPPQTSDELLIAAAMPYLDPGANSRLSEVFEAAHSVMLSVLSSPRCGDVARMHLPLYVNALFAAFPQNLSPRQFRFAFKTLLRITTPPSLLSMSNPDLPETLIELVHRRALSSLTNSAPPLQSSNDSNEEPLDESTTLVLTLIDSLPFLPYDVLERSLPSVAELIDKLGSSDSRQRSKERFWEVLSNGEMDVDRNHVCLAWWTTRGGREMVLLAGDPTVQPAERPMMSGALLDNNVGSPESML